MKTILSGISRQGFLFTTICVVSMQVFAVSPFLCEPRTGDKMTVDYFPGKPAIENDTTNIVSIYGMNPSAKLKMEIWAPTPEDSISKFYVLMDREMKKVSSRNGENREIFCVRPGYTRQFIQGQPYGLIQRTHTDELFESRCRIDGVTNCFTSGKLSSSKREGVYFISQEGDTIRDVTNVKIVVSDSLHFPAESIYHKGVYKKWYAPGYRYPILFTTTDTIYSSDGVLIDSNSKCYSISAISQEEQIKNDPVNEEIREALAELNRQKAEGDYKPRSNKNDNTPSYIRWTDKNTLTVTKSFGSEPFTEILLCDIQGHLYFVTGCEDNLSEYQIDISGFNPGMYLLHIVSGSETKVYRFWL